MGGRLRLVVVVCSVAEVGGHGEWTGGRQGKNDSLRKRRGIVSWFC